MQEKDPISIIIGVLFWIFVLGGWFTYSEYSRVTLMPARYVMNEISSNPNLSAAVATGNRLIEFFGRHGMNKEETYGIYRVYASSLGSEDDINPKSLSNYYFCLISMKKGQKIIEMKEKFYNIATLRLRLQNDEKVLKYAGIYDSITNSAVDREKELSPIFSECWNDAKAGRVRFNPPFPVERP